MHHSHEDALEYMRSHIHAHLHGLNEHREDLSALELATLIRMTAGLYEAIGTQHVGDTEVSAARGRLMMRLLADDVDGPGNGMTPSSLSRFAHVSPNTVSSLLRGLEEQGMIERELDRTDHRLFRIRLSHAGRRLVKSHAPRHIARLTELASDLSPDEQAQLVTLLERLYRSILAHGQASPPAQTDDRADR